MSSPLQTRVKKLLHMFWNKKNSTKVPKFTCSSCGELHEQWPALAFDAPIHYFNLPQEHKENAAQIDADFCKIQFRDSQQFFIRGVLIQEVTDACDHLEYGVWVSLSEKSFLNYYENFRNEGHETVYFGWLSNEIAEYQNTSAIPCNVVTQLGNKRPHIIPHQSFEHPFIHDYYNGISKQEVLQRIQGMR